MRILGPPAAIFISEKCGKPLDFNGFMEIHHVLPSGSPIATAENAHASIPMGKGPDRSA
jgi:hypothetical protein